MVETVLPETVSGPFPNFEKLSEHFALAHKTNVKELTKFWGPPHNLHGEHEGKNHGAHWSKPSSRQQYSTHLQVKQNQSLSGKLGILKRLGVFIFKHLK